MDQLKRGTQILYVPSHAQGNPEHPDVEVGFVTSGPANGDAYFCRYWRKDGTDLRTKTCSELTPIWTIVVKDTYPQEKIDAALTEYC